MGTLNLSAMSSVYGLPDDIARIFPFLKPAARYTGDALPALKRAGYVFEFPSSGQRKDQVRNVVLTISACFAKAYRMNCELQKLTTTVSVQVECQCLKGRKYVFL